MIRGGRGSRGSRLEYELNMIHRFERDTRWFHWINLVVGSHAKAPIPAQRPTWQGKPKVRLRQEEPIALRRFRCEPANVLAERKDIFIHRLGVFDGTKMPLVFVSAVGRAPFLCGVSVLKVPLATWTYGPVHHRSIISPAKPTVFRNSQVVNSMVLCAGPTIDRGCVRARNRAPSRAPDRAPSPGPEPTSRPRLGSALARTPGQIGSRGSRGMLP